MDFNAVAHDLRTPLNVMLGHMQLLAVERLSDTGRQRLGIVERQIRRMMRLLDSCSGQRSDGIHRGTVDLSAMIRSVVSELDALLERRSIEVRLTIRGCLPCVDGDGDLLHRVLLNVLVNAVDSMEEGGCIKITAHTDRVPESEVGTVHIQIADSGTGIPPELVARVFDQGFTTKGNRDTHGLGLNICQEVMTLHGGDIQLSSELGKGTAVHLTFPIT
jgi:signal transduction histidine kinase